MRHLIDLLYLLIDLAMFAVIAAVFAAVVIYAPMIGAALDDAVLWALR